MKEATGELNMTVITVVAIAAVAAFFYAFVWPSIQASLILTTACNSTDASGNYTGEGVECKGDNGTISCEYTNGNRHFSRNCDSK